MPRFSVMALVIVVAVAHQLTDAATASDTTISSHPPMRPLPTAFEQGMTVGSGYFVDGQRGDDRYDGSQARPWRTLQHAIHNLLPGDTLYVRQGIYYKTLAVTCSGSPGQPITIRSYPGELAIIDGGLREFYEQPESAWQPCDDGAAGEYISTRCYPRADRRHIPNQFLPAAWEPFWGIEEERPLALGFFADSMIPLHGYRRLEDLRSDNEYWQGKASQRGTYCGPGLWYNRHTGRVHIRLAHHRLNGLGQASYRGPIDPRQLPLVVSLGFGQEVLRLCGVTHVRVQGLVFRGATGSPLIHIYGCQDLELDHITAYGGFPALLVNASRNVKITHSAFRGNAAPWSSRAHMKYLGTPSYQIIFHNGQPLNENVEIAWCEFTDDHDFAFVRYVRNLRFHHNYIDNFNDDGLEVGPKLRSHTVYVFQNYIGRCLIPFSQHEIVEDESPIEHAPGSGLYIFRNIIDLRGGVYVSPPPPADSQHKSLYQEGHLASDHGSPIWPVMRFYQNTVLRSGPGFRNYYLFGLAVQGLRHSERDVFNNIFAQLEGEVVVNFGPDQEVQSLREGGNLIWCMSAGQPAKDPYENFRKSAVFERSRQVYPAGWTSHDRYGDPKFVSMASQKDQTDLRLQPMSAAIDAGLALPEDWPDPLKSTDSGEPDIGAVPYGAVIWGVGIDGRIDANTGLLRPAAKP